MRMGLWLVLVALGCSGAEQSASEPSSGQTEAEQVAPEQVAPPAQPGEPQVAEGYDPWGNSAPDDDVNDACEDTAHTPGPECNVNSDCGICHNGSQCGHVANRSEIETRGAECRQEDSAECHSFRVRCCSGHCVRTGY